MGEAGALRPRAGGSATRKRAKDPEVVAAERRARGERLRALGVRDDLADYLSAVPPRPVISTLLSLAVLPIMLAGFGAGILLWRDAEAETIRRALAHAAAEGALLYDTNFGVGLLIGLFAWICASGVLLSGLHALLSMEMRAALLAKGLIGSQRNPVAARVTRHAIEGIPSHYRPEEAIAHMSHASVHWMASSALLLGALSAITLARELDTHTLFTPTAVVRSPLFPWSPSGARPYAEATHVELGCNHVTGKSAGDHVKYVIHFADGADFDVGSAMAIRGDWLDHAERIDFALRRERTRFVRWSWLNRDPLHRACVTANASEPRRRERLERLLRADGAGLTRD